jgi:hypothetical protein
LVQIRQVVARMRDEFLDLAIVDTLDFPTLIETG